MKNLAAKTRDRSNPYEKWQSFDGTWTWNVLKKWQTPEKEKANIYARWFCDVVTPICPNGEMGDVYVREIKENATMIYRDPAYQKALDEQKA